MNIAPPPQSLTPEPPVLGEAQPVAAPRESRLRRLADILLGRSITLVLAAVALALGIATFIVLVGHLPSPNQAFALVLGNLTVLLRRDPDIGSVTECESGLEAIDEIRRSKPDLVFLDVQMPECGGSDVLNKAAGSTSA